MAQFKEQIKALKIELTDEEIANLSDTEFKILVIRILTEMVEDGLKIEEKAKAMQSEIKKNIQPWLVWLSGLSVGLQIKGMLVSFLI